MNSDSTEKIVVIIANGDTLKQKLKNCISEEDAIIAVDGGVINCQIVNIIPDFIVGDLDSIRFDLKKYFPAAEIIHNPDQETTDMEKALNLAISLHPKKINVFSAFGKRTDHTIGNILIFHKMIKLILDKSIELEIFDNFGKMRVLNSGTHEIKGEIGSTVSLFSIDPIQNLTLKGFRYNLKNQDFPNNFLGISNVYESEICEINFDSGILFLYDVFSDPNSDKPKPKN
ncbi:MAG: thiamine diphosphokinase [Armatimonadetes bacterium]|nr:thiamine diphosphokinase [Armatimonadota bacterium]